jgi:hypothetical protein
MTELYSLQNLIFQLFLEVLVFELRASHLLWKVLYHMSHVTALITLTFKEEKFLHLEAE